MSTDPPPAPTAAELLQLAEALRAVHRASMAKRLPCSAGHRPILASAIHALTQMSRAAGNGET